MIILPHTADGIAQAAQAIAANRIVAYPTETVYGLGANPFSEEAVGRLFDAKGRNADHAILLIVADQVQLRRVAAQISPRAQACIDAFWPGPLSLIFPRAQALSDAVTGGRDTICVRCPASPTARDLCQAVGHAITSTSANRTGLPPATDVSQIDLPGVHAAIDAGTLPPSPPSTIYNPETGDMLREGAISSAALTHRLGNKIIPS